MNTINHYFTLTKDFGKIHYVRIGTGPVTIVLVHGWSMSWRIWSKFLEIVNTEKFTVYAIDMPGFGRSDKPNMEYSISNLADSVISFIHQLGLKNVVIGGHSMGGLVCLEAITRKKLNVSGFIIADSVSKWFNNGTREWERNMRNTLETTNDRKGALRNIEEYFFEKISEEDLSEFTSDAMKVTDQILVGSAEALCNFDCDSYLDMLSLPVVIFYGEHDRIVSLDDVHHLNKNIPDSELIVIDNAGHCPIYEQPQVFTTAFEKWTMLKIPSQ